ncbi:GumC domain-containing protein [Fusibacter ferrireducens]|uniref:Polysaccharide chain length determinant N-terminal domain-containing protein n=1 Tax=Fusibacter ferrireducens TaxID=2785058 RepID=A0ABR9ZXD1_9FIRM|nr:hypothetical protein [Fusibacter ferrireducens]MBF4695127.1 hypothetical protein [Fusibacter ferrireducens]
MPEEQYDEISLKELIQNIIDNRKLILLVTCIALLFSIVFSWYQMGEGKSAKVIMAFHYSGIEKHLNPDGSKFDPYQVVSPYILNDVIQILKLEGKVSANKIRALVTMEPIIPSEVVSKQEYALEKEGDSYVYFPNEYILSLKVSQKSNLDAETAKRIVNQIIASYQAYFSETYLTQKPVINKISGVDFGKYDYSDVATVLHSQVTEIKQFSSALSTVDSGFRSKQTGQSFSDLVEMADLIDDINLNRLDANISAYKLTKDKDKLIMFYEYVIEELEFQKAKYNAETVVTKEMLSSIEDSSNKVLSGITGDSTDQSSYFNNLILKTVSTSVNASSIQEQIDYYQREVQELKSETAILSGSKAEMLTTVENSISNISNELKALLVLTKETTDEFYDQYITKSFYALSPAEVYSKVKMTLNIAIGGILGLMAGVFIAFFRAYWEKED